MDITDFIEILTEEDIMCLESDTIISLEQHIQNKFDKGTNPRTTKESFVGDRAYNLKVQNSFLNREGMGFGGY